MGVDPSFFITTSLSYKLLQKYQNTRGSLHSIIVHNTSSKIKKKTPNVNYVLQNISFQLIKIQLIFFRPIFEA